MVCVTFGWPGKSTLKPSWMFWYSVQSWAAAAAASPSTSTQVSEAVRITDSPFCGRKTTRSGEQVLLHFRVLEAPEHVVDEVMVDVDEQHRGGEEEEHLPGVERA